MPIASIHSQCRSVLTGMNHKRCLIMVPSSLGRATLPSSLDFRLRFANRIVEESWQERKTMWGRDDIGLLLLEVLDEEMAFDWTQPTAVEEFKDYLALAYIAAGDVLPASQRAF